MTNTNTENREHCKLIAEELDAIAEGRCYRCPECGDLIFFGEEDTRACPVCGTEINPEELEPFTMWDYFNDVYDIEYRVDAEKKLPFCVSDGRLWRPEYLHRHSSCI